MRLSDGSEIRFPESYNANTLAQGAAILLRDPAGNELKLNRDRQRNLIQIRPPTLTGFALPMTIKLAS